MADHLKIDFVSDVACPWCIIGLKGLQAALERLDGEVIADIRFQPFELNPEMGTEGQNLGEHIAQKYGSTPEQSAASRAMIMDRAAALGFTITMSPDSRIYNTFNAHRLLYWAGEEGRQTDLKLALFRAYFTDGRNVADHAVLLDAVEEAGLDRKRALTILESDMFAAAVRDEEALWRSRGINSVPAIIVNEKYLISGGQSAEAFEQALRQIAKEGQMA
ncbi:DsbA family oxidoreductase [Sphingobium sp. WCS2017Hpa-17]|uniref:DsbA family oxidoreductase n=1 Tax=Sphingobium sp. WCS2017Hpa-17 TaxID=3073638 RepID=UPI00288B00B2|nr:DsbA family oxidoreductase [Sphingobium sp. WCS2017Hpa-17]